MSDLDHDLTHADTVTKLELRIEHPGKATSRISLKPMAYLPRISERMSFAMPDGLYPHMTGVVSSVSQRLEQAGTNILRTITVTIDATKS